MQLKLKIKLQKKFLLAFEVNLIDIFNKNTRNKNKNYISK